MEDKNYWRMLAGDPPHQSKILGDWLIGNFISMYGDRIKDVSNDPLAAYFKGVGEKSLQIGDKIVIYTNKCVFGFGEIISEMKTNPASGVKNHPYKNWRKVHWLKVTKIQSSQMPPSVKKRITRDPSRYIKPLDKGVWETLLLLA